MTTINVLIAEDQTLMRAGLRTILELSDGFAVVGEAENGRQALERALALRPDVVLMDVQMPELNGVEATAQITQALPATKVILLTTFDYDAYIFDGIRAGAQAYLLKDVPMAELLDTIRRIHAGESIVQPSVAARLIAELRQRPAAPAQPAAEPLSERELEVLRLLADGWTNKAIAARLVLTEGTVKNYVSAILDKLHAANRTQATQIARKHGLLE
ncbi:MAG: response regulator transcription factor [Kouleothrix sp.]|nr:response regulator transcription factor [Kouleothrix sp.]